MLAAYLTAPARARHDDSVDRREHQETLRHQARRQHHVVDVLVIEPGAHVSRSRRLPSRSGSGRPSCAPARRTPGSSRLGETRAARLALVDELAARSRPPDERVEGDDYADVLREAAASNGWRTTLALCAPPFTRSPCS